MGKDPFTRATSQVPHTSPSLVVNLGGEGEFVGALDMNNRVFATVNTLNHDMLIVWPIAANSMEAVIGNRLPGFSFDQFLFIASESRRVLIAGGQIRIFSLGAPANLLERAITVAGFRSVHLDGITVIGSK
jgi:hypothetical protein